MRPRFAVVARHSCAKRSYHDCGAPGCTEKVSRSRLLCLAHWRALPFQLREAIKLTWARRGQDGFAPWSANVLAARTFLANHNPAADAARITGDRS